MAVIRLQFETNIAYWRKVRRRNNRKAHYIRIGKDSGLQRGRSQQSFAAAATHRIPEEKRIGTKKALYYELDNSHKFVSYDDAIEVGFDFIPSVSFLDLEESFNPETPKPAAFLTQCGNVLQQDLHFRRNDYEGVFWGISYTVLHEDFADHSVRFTDMFSWPENDIDLIRNQFDTIQGDIMNAFGSYENIIVHRIFVKYRNNDLEL